MRSLHVSIDVPQSRGDVYDYLDVLANHEQFTDHLMRNWRLSGPPRGVGPKATVDVVLGRRTEPVEIEVIEVEALVRNVERNIGAAGKRVATGTYTLDELPGGRTRINFDYSWQQIPLGERLVAPLVRRAMRPALETAMRRLAEQLATRD
jgi:Polyketide cyclase / dehydrase and lipid transport